MCVAERLYRKLGCTSHTNHACARNLLELGWLETHVVRLVVLRYAEKGYFFIPLWTGWECQKESPRGMGRRSLSAYFA